MHKLKLIAAVAAVLVGSPAVAQEITVWDVNVDDPSHASYYDHAKAAFEAAHPGATLTFLSQPDAEYYTLLGTALASKTGPDVIWANGGAQAKNLIGGLIPLDDKLPDLIRRSSASRPSLVLTANSTLSRRPCRATSSTTTRSSTRTPGSIPTSRRPPGPR